MVSSPCALRSPTTQGLPELGGELLDDSVGLHVEDMVFQGDAGHLLQGAHVRAVHPHGVDLDARGPGGGRHLLHLVLGPPVRDDDGHLGDLAGARAGARLLGEGLVHGRLDGQARHGSGRQGLDAGDGLLHVEFVQVILEEELDLDRAGVVDHRHPGGVGSHVQRVHHVGQEDLDLLKFARTHTARAVNDEHQIQGTTSALRICFYGKQSQALP